MAPNTASFADLLRSAVTDPGIVSSAYRQFHNYSIGNQLLAWAQCLARGHSARPMATFPSGRTGPTRPQGREGDHALPAGDDQADARRPTTAPTRADVFTRFIYRPHWFVLAQTDGADLPAVDDAQPGTPRERSQPSTSPRSPSTRPTATSSAYARGRSIAVSTRSTRCRTRRASTSWRMCCSATPPRATQHDGELTPRNLRECEAEAVAMLCCAALICPASSSAAGTSRAGGAPAIRSPSARRSGS